MYPTGPPSVAGWQTSQNFATMGYGFQYPAAAVFPITFFYYWLIVFLLFFLMLTDLLLHLL